MDCDFDDLQQQTLDHLSASAELRQTWWRYHLISDVIQQNLPDCMDRQLVSRISREIAAEPVSFAPRNIRINNLFRPVAGLAIAASVAVIAVLGFQTVGQQQPVQQQSQQVVDSRPVYNSNISQYTFPVTSNVVSNNTDAEVTTELESNSRLNSYLVNYNEFRATQTGVQGINPYVRILANEDDK